MLKVLVAAKGAWVGGKILQGRPDHTRNRMPNAVKEIIDTDPKNGYRIRPTLFHT